MSICRVSRSCARQLGHHRRVRAVLIAGLLTAGCGRLGFDAGNADSPPDDAVASDADLSTLLTDCLLRMSMDEPAWTGAPGEVKDSCGGHDGTASGGATTILDDVRGRVGIFIGDPSCVQVADATLLQPTTRMTVSAWISPTALAPASFGVISRRTSFGVDVSYSFFIWTDTDGTGTTNQLYVDIDGENDRVPDPNATFLNEWHQVTVVYDGTRAQNARVQFYVDGELSFTAPESSAAIAPTMGAPPLSVGCLPLGGPAQSLVGRLDEVVVWARALDGDEVAQWYAATKP
jgi:hypothetical protein